MRKLKPKSYDYIEKLAPLETELMQEARKNSEKLGLETISISATEAGLIKYHLQSVQAKKVVEIGTLTGLSALHVLSVLPDGGKLWTLEKSEEHAKLAELVLKDEIQNNRCEILIGDAREKLKELNSQAPFDAVFIDGNKAAYLDYFNWAYENVREGGMILVDNIFLAGAVWGGKTSQNFNAKQIRTVQDMNEKAFSDKKLISVIVPTEEGLLVCKKQSS
ncbi:MAG: O-methyltransferase [Bdellovibrio sp.]|nr:O-methyltransferase [Bdellovibrio sp.]